MSDASTVIYSYRPAGRVKPPIPLAVRKAVLVRANRACECCGEKRPLELHHLHYETEGCEHPDDLQALCRECHLRAHIDPAGDFWADPAEMANYWWSYFKELAKD